MNDILHLTDLRTVNINDLWITDRPGSGMNYIISRYQFSDACI